MRFNYCPNCGFGLTHLAFASNPPIPVVKCDRCGWEMRAGRAPSWNTVSNSTEGMRINWQPQEDITRAEYDFDSTPRVPPEHKMLKEEKVMREQAECRYREDGICNCPSNSFTPFKCPYADPEASQKEGYIPCPDWEETKR